MLLLCSGVENKLSHFNWNFRNWAFCCGLKLFSLQNVSWKSSATSDVEARGKQWFLLWVLPASFLNNFNILMLWSMQLNFGRLCLLWKGMFSLLLLWRWFFSKACNNWIYARMAVIEMMCFLSAETGIDPVLVEPHCLLILTRGYMCHLGISAKHACCSPKWYVKHWTSVWKSV